MQEAENLKSITLEEFDAMERDERFRYELIDGTVLMSPRPTRDHQRINFKLAKAIDGLLDTPKCEVLQEIELPLNKTSIVPDLSIICGDECKDENSLPLVVIEILSPSTAQHDLFYKLNKYHDLGISEYWIVDPKAKSITIHYFFNKTAETFGLGDTAASLVRPEIQIELAKLFA